MIKLLKTIPFTSSYLLLLFIDDFSAKNLGVYAVVIILGVMAQIYMLLSVKYKEEKFD
ncbi:hypothetical protein KKA15_02810 [Patescibacteria group bacterium]|nr:hypothetical protein [Patescibacteria group bacterium]